MRTSTLFWGAILILVGAFLLLNNLGVISIDIWRIFWPIVLIMLGGWVLLGVFLRKSPQVEHASLPLEGASRAHLLVKHGAGRLRIRSGVEPGMLAEGEFGGGLDLITRRDGDMLDAAMRMPMRQWAFPFGWGPGFSLDWSFGLAKDLPLHLELETGANEAQIDLTDVLVTDLSIKSGASSTEVTLPSAAGHTRARISTGAASVRVNVPSNVAIKMRASAGMGSIHVDRRRFPHQGSYYQSDDYESAENKVELEIETGVGSVDVR